MIDQLQGKTVFVTGGSGFVGGRLIEVLVKQFGVHVRALVNRPAAALRMARFPLDFVFGDMTDGSFMADAIRGCDIVFHLAFGKNGTEEEQKRVTVEGTRAILEACKLNGVSRLVNVSTAAVYGTPNVDRIDEQSPRKHGSWHYPNMKLDAEHLVEEFSARGGVAATTIQLVGVYGPWGDVFTVGPLKQLQSGVIVLPGAGDGLTNCTYVDDVVQALLLAAYKEAAIGERFLVKGPGNVTRLEYLNAYVAMLPDAQVVCMPVAEMKQKQKAKAWRMTKALLPQSLSALKSHVGFKDAVRGSVILPVAKFAASRLKKKGNSAPSAAQSDNGVLGKELIYPPAFMLSRLMMKAEFDDTKAKQKLGYCPQYDLKAGMALTQEWAKWARLITSE